VDGLIQPGQTLRMDRAAALITVEKRIGEGGQGVVHAARLNGAPFAVKWFRPGLGSDEMRKAITALVQRGRPPHPAFVWPIDLVGSDKLPGFGYVMPLLEPRFVSLAQLLNQDMQPSFRVIATIGRELVDAFAALHSAGLCYRDISFGNLRVDPSSCEVAIIDVDNVGSDGANAQVKGTGPFMAPEVLRDEALPSTATDLHSLAVLLFYLLMHGHPLLGVRADASYTWDRDGHMSETEVLVRNFGLEPVFIFDPDDPSNRPLPGDRVVLWWGIYPQQCRRVFTQAFTAGLRDASLNGRVTEGTWRRALLSLHDCVSSCAACGAALFHDPEQSGQRCWHCAGPLPPPLRLKAPGGTLVLSEGAVVSSHHLNRDRDYRTVCAVVEPHPGRPGRVVIRNLTGKTWTVVPDGEESKRVAPSQRLGVRPLLIDFGSVRGQIL
jgi:DNA-binding helix-hairpin-helix protein with protein kinase domain